MMTAPSFTILADNRETRVARLPRLYIQDEHESRERQGLGRGPRPR